MTTEFLVIAGLISFHLIGHIHSLTKLGVVGFFINQYLITLNLLRLPVPGMVYLFISIAYVAVPSSLGWVIGTHFMMAWVAFDVLLKFTTLPVLRYQRII